MLARPTKESPSFRAESCQLIIKALATPRVGWDEMFCKMAEQGDDAMLDEDLPLETTWDREEWQW